jgi:phosphoglucosamine mutase
MDMLSKNRFERKWRVILDPGNGAACQLSSRIYGELLDGVSSINSVPDGSFRARGSEPTAKNERALGIAVVETGADAGIAFDGDGDRMFIVDEKGNRPLQDRVLAAYISFLSAQSKGPFLVPLDASMAIEDVSESHEARIIRGPVGDALLLREMKRSGARFAGEPSGAWIHYDHNPTPDGMLSGLLFLKSVERQRKTVSKTIESVPQYTMIRQSIGYSKKLTRAKLVSLERGLQRLLGRDSSTSTRFGLRVSTAQSWILVRESGTEPVIRVTGESKQPSETLRLMRESLRLLRNVLKSRT